MAKAAERLGEASTRRMRHFRTRRQGLMAEGQHHHVTHAVSNHTQASSQSCAHSSHHEDILGQRH